MFRNRTNSQKPADELYANFRQSFPELRSTQAPVTTAEQQAAAVAVTQTMADTLLDHHQPAYVQALREEHCDEADQTAPNSHLSMDFGHDETKDSEHDLKELHEPWRLTPSMLDPNSYAFSSFANQPPGYYTPTPGGTATVYHSTAGDLHTPLGVGLGTPLSLPTSDGGFQTGHSTLDISAFHPEEIHQQHSHFSNFNPFGEQRTFAPSDFTHQQTGHYEGEEVDADGDLSPSEDFAVTEKYQGTSQSMRPPTSSAGLMKAPPLPSSEKFRFNVTLNAPTAMVRNSDEIPVTYLNKGQAYSISITDSTPPALRPAASPPRYRTFIRVSFEDEQQRQRPAACWQLWKEGRGTNEAYQRGGKLQAVEFVDAGSNPEDSSNSANISLLSASFDGFSVTWSPTSESASDCSIAVRFNFLSTDFSHSKGVKGIPVRLCAKTELLADDSTTTSTSSAEVCYCKVKLFRDHGAERKLSNDIAHVKKTIDKLRQQIASAESGVKDSNKRKRSGSTVINPRAGKVLKHKRTWSVSGASEGTSKPSVEDDLHNKLAIMQDMFTSTRPASVFYLRGEEQDDPDKSPVNLAVDFSEQVKRSISREDSWSQQRESADGYDNPSRSSLGPNSPSSGSHITTAMTASAFHPGSIKLSPVTSHKEWSGLPAVTSDDVQSTKIPNIGASLDAMTRVPKSGTGEYGATDGWIEAIGVDPSYQPTERPIKPVACFYIRQNQAVDSAAQNVHRAVYLTQLTAKDFVIGVCSKLEIEPTRVLKTTHQTQNGLTVLVDDDVVREIPEGQDMTVEFIETIVRPTSEKPEVIVDQVNPQSEADVSATHDASPVGLELRLSY